MNALVWIGRLEGVSFLVLLLIAMPLKYIWGQPEAVRLLGSIHGALFVLFLAGVLIVSRRMNWGINIFIVSAIFASLPFGTFYFEKKYIKPH
jgi:integral membrane protein